MAHPINVVGCPVKRSFRWFASVPATRFVPATQLGPDEQFAMSDPLASEYRNCLIYHQCSVPLTLCCKLLCLASSDTYACGGDRNSRPVNGLEIIDESKSHKCVSKSSKALLASNGVRLAAISQRCRLTMFKMEITSSAKFCLICKGIVLPSKHSFTDLLKHVYFFAMLEYITSIR